jgi:uncharacterized protein
MNVDWGGLLSAVGLVLVIEGLLPFVNPAGAKRTFESIAKLPERELRVGGVVAVGAGLLILFLVRA